MNLLDELKKLQIKAGSTIDDAKSGMSEGFRVTPEDRRDVLYRIRGMEKKAEPPRAVQTLVTQPGIDLLRQLKTVHPNLPIPVKPIEDKNFLLRGTGGLNFGPNAPADANLNSPGEAERYKRMLREQSVMRKLGYLGGTAAQDIVNDASRSIWWLVNAPQAVTNLSSELSAAVANPDLFASRDVPLQEAIDKGWVSYKQPKLSEEDLKKRVAEISADEEISLLNKLATGEMDPENPYTSEQFDKDLAVLQERSKRIAQETFDKDARETVANYKRARPGIKVRGNTILKRRFNPNLVNAATLIPAAIGINAGIGLLGRQEGYAATVPDENDPRKTSNVIAEVASKYLAGREGRLMEMEDFILERPDVTPAEYQQYRNYLRDRDIDLNPIDDGKINLGGILKTNPDGIRGAEVQFMGKSLPVNDTLLPTIGAALGTAAGAALTNAGSIRLRGGFKDRRGLNKLKGLIPEVLPRDLETDARVYAREGDGPMRRMQQAFDKDDGWKHNARVMGTVAGGGLLGLAGGTLTGDALEDNRRRANFNENFRAEETGLDYDEYKASGKKILEEKIKRQENNPNADQERGESRVGFSKRSQQQALMNETLAQQAQVNQIINAERRERANALLDGQRENNREFQEIENSIGARKEKEDELTYPLVGMNDGTIIPF